MVAASATAILIDISFSACFPQNRQEAGSPKYFLDYFSQAFLTECVNRTVSTRPWDSLGRAEIKKMSETK